ncbi:PRTRC system protein B [Emticicia sp. TH156]|uniref:PRTRC system protein B n=1 Tax=Emticicia sp. TH156 TaxID=2067454 RepID=UPI000C78FD2D|nr:PRTRC system protein B [Emticicia sp. TH156]PLK44870.1 PRTRC system protein B [Emticicia sp. TH156]
MNKATDITADFGTLYFPTSALVFYQTEEPDVDTYVEHFDMDGHGNPMNAHPLTIREARVLAKALNIQQEEPLQFLKPHGVFSVNILHINPNEKGSVLWYTKARKQNLYFVESLGIPEAKVSIPALLWLADKRSLSVYALASNRRPDEHTPLYHAPFLNVYANGNVCMGTVNVNSRKSASLEEFTAAWESCFFNSYFSHLMPDHQPVKGNCVNLWKKLVHTSENFPKEVLLKNGKTLKSLLR